MGDPIENPDVHWITKAGHHIPIPNRPMTPQERGRLAPKVTPETRAIAARMQHVVARLVGGTVIPDNDAYDVQVGMNMIEVKTLVDAKNDKLHFKRAQRLFKQSMYPEYKHWTIGVDARQSRSNPTFYLFPGLGAFMVGKKNQAVPGWVITDIFSDPRIRSGNFYPKMK